jgi:xylan 1,4-beta-xylosidase
MRLDLPFAALRRLGPCGLALCLLALVSLVRAGDSLENESVRAVFGPTGLTELKDKSAASAVQFAEDGFAVFAADDSVEAEFLAPSSVEAEFQTQRVYRYESGPWRVRVIYELQPGWRFITKQVSVEGTGKRDFRIHRIEPFRGQVQTPLVSRQSLRSGVLLRLSPSSAQTGQGLFMVLQNPFLQLKQQGQRLSLAYAPDLVCRPGEPVVSDRLCIGPTTLSSVRFPTRMVPEWNYAPGAAPQDEAWIDRAEVDAIVECVRAFLLWRPTHSQRVHVGWCENDYQIDVASPEGRAEYRRIIDQAAAVGCRDILFAPANSGESSLAENRDAWGWENLLWFGMGQKLRKGAWDPARDSLPAATRELVDYARSKDVRLLAYVYPSLPFLQQKEWTAWVPNGRPGGYLGADTGLRSFQDWLLDQLVAFHHSTGAGGYSFDHWWIAYDETSSSRYRQWQGCKRVLEELRRRIPDVVIDGRQQYHGFGVWTWLAGTYPHPLCSDEQPESFRAFPDPHWSRVSADRQRRTAWTYRMENFVPPEIMPGYMTHQTPRLDEKGNCPRTRFRPADWDLLGWKYSVISAVGTAPFNHVVNFLPSRDEREFSAFSHQDQQWLRRWLDWTDRNQEVLRNLKPILGPPQQGRIDATAALKAGHGFIFVFNPNYRRLQARFTLDQAIGLAEAGDFVLRQLYPDAEKGRLWAPEAKAFWSSGDTVTLPMAGADALVLELAPAPKTLQDPLLLGACGKASRRGDSLELTEVLGEVGTQRSLAVVLDTATTIRSVKVNGIRTDFLQTGSQVRLETRFSGVPFAGRQQIGTYDPQFSGGRTKAVASIPGRVWGQLQQRRRQWPVDYNDTERAAVWLNSDRLLLFINVAEPDDETMKGVTLTVDGQAVQVRPAYTSIVRSNPKNTFTGWTADVSSLSPDVPHTFEVSLPSLAAGQFQGLFLDTVEAEYTTEVVPNDRPLAIRRLMDTPLRDTSICRGPDGTWYLTGTVEPFWAYNEGIKLWRSKDLVTWEPLGLVWKYGASPWHKPYLEKKKPLWAPEVHYLKGTFWLTYSIPGWDGTAKTSGCGLLKSTTGRAEGPYQDVQPDERLGDEIDASLFQDDDGTVYFVWHSGKIAPMKPDMSGLAEPYRWLRTTIQDPDPAHHSSLCAGIFGKDSFDHVGYEGMFLFKVNGRYILTCSDHCDGRYSCYATTSTSVYGPYGPRYEAIPHGGHNMFFQDGQGQWWSTYFGSDDKAPWQERPGILAVDVDPEGRVRPASPGEPGK